MEQKTGRAMPLVLVSVTPDGVPIYRPLTPAAEQTLTFNGEMLAPVNAPRNGYKPPAPTPAGPTPRHARTVPHYVWVSGLLILAGALWGIGWLIYTSLILLFALLPLILGGGAVLVFILALAFGRGKTINQYARIG